MALTKDQKKELNKRIKGLGISPKTVFDFINNENPSLDQIEALILDLAEEVRVNEPTPIHMNPAPIDYAVFGKPIIDANAIYDMNSIMSLPYVIDGALMPDAHRVKEKHVPVGGVVLSDAIIPAIVGSDISCSVLLSITSVPVDDNWFANNVDALRYILRNYSYFGAEIAPNPVLFDMDFYKNRPLKMRTFDGQSIWDSAVSRARTAFGTSGDGNHFVEFGMVNVKSANFGYNIVPSRNKYLAIMSHFGSRSVGSTIAKGFEKAALDQYKMPKGMTDAPLDPNSDLGKDYIEQMNWAGEFAEEGHRHLHHQLFLELGKRVNLSFSSKDIYSRHNFAWETSQGWLHRKGATPANPGEYGVIPATMGDKTQIVMGIGNPLSLNSASHGAGRTHSRGRALQEFGGSDTAEFLLKEYGVHLIGAGADEDPRAYKNISDVMKHQSDCVTSIGEFSPKVVRMADPRFSWRR